jgi:DNA methylase
LALGVQRVLEKAHERAAPQRRRERYGRAIRLFVGRSRLFILIRPYCTSVRTLVFDPYTDSGTTAVAKELNRAFIGVELEEELAKRAVRRMAATQRGSLLREISEQPWSNA